MPDFNEKKKRWETSIQRIARLTSSEVWAVGYQHAEHSAARRVIKARADGQIDQVTRQKLSLDVNGPPYPRHVDIVGWPESDKDARLMRATEISESLNLVMDPRPKN